MSASNIVSRRVVLHGAVAAAPLAAIPASAFADTPGLLEGDDAFHVVWKRFVKAKDALDSNRNDDDEDRLLEAWREALHEMVQTPARTVHGIFLK